jgi:hypothetical protein
MDSKFRDWPGRIGLVGFGLGNGPGGLVSGMGLGVTMQEFGHE